MITVSVFCTECEVILVNSCSMKEAQIVAETHLEEEHF